MGCGASSGDAPADNGALASVMPKDASDSAGQLAAASDARSEQQGALAGMIPGNASDLTGRLAVASESEVTAALAQLSPEARSKLDGCCSSMMQERRALREAQAPSKRRQDDQIDIVDEINFPRLCAAAWKGHLNAARTLLLDSFDVDQCISVGNARRTPLYLSAELGHIDVLRLLLAARANMDAKADKDTLDPEGDTPLNIASFKGHIAVVKALLDAGAAKDQPNHIGATPLFFAAQNGHPQIVQALLDAQAQKDQPNKKNGTPLLISAYNGHTGVVRLLLAAKANQDTRDSDGDTALKVASAGRHQAVVDMLKAAK